MMHAKAEQLLQAHLQFIIAELQSEQTVLSEVTAWLEHLSAKTVEQLVTLEHLQQLIGQQLLERPLQSQLLAQVVEQLRFALEHPDNLAITLGELIPAETIEQIADYVAKQQEHRAAFIHRVFNNPAYAHMLSQTISHAISDYMENNVLARKMPGVGGLMKLGKNVLERATDSNLDDALQHYLNKNISSLIGISEKMANRHLSNEYIYQLITQGWQSIARQPVGFIKQYIDMQNLDSSAHLAGAAWDSIRIGRYLRDQLNDGIAHWYVSNKQHRLSTLLEQINIAPELINSELKALGLPLIRLLIDEGFVVQRVESRLRAFYGSEAVNAILAD